MDKRKVLQLVTVFVFATVMIVSGCKGQRGPRGYTGIQGGQGIQGTQGIPGLDGPSHIVVTASPVNVNADVGSVTVTANVIDPAGAGVSGLTVAITAVPVGTVGSVTDNGNGSYTATVSGLTTAGDVYIGVTSGNLTPAYTMVYVKPGPAVSSTNSLVSAFPLQLPADGTSSSALTIIPVDAHGNRIGKGAAVTVAASGSETITGPVDMLDGSYVAQVTDNTAETVSPVIQANSVTLTSPSITFAATPIVDLMVSATPGLLVVGRTSVVTVGLWIDGVLTPGRSVTIVGSGSSVTGAVTDNEDGSYTATVTDNVAEGIVVTVMDDATGANKSVTIIFVPGPVSPTTTTLSFSPPATSPVQVPGFFTLTFTPKDALGNPLGPDQSLYLTVSGDAYFSPAGYIDNGDGTYTLYITDDTAETVTVDSFVNGDYSGSQNITFAPGPIDAVVSTNIPGSSTAIVDYSISVTVTPMDQFGNVIGSGQSFYLLLSGSTGGSPFVVGGIYIDNGDGTYTADISDLTAEDVTITAVVNGITLASAPVVTFLPDVVDPYNSLVIANPTTLLAGQSVTVTVTPIDQWGNWLGAGQAVTVTSTGSAHGTGFTDNGDGTYTATGTDTVAETVTLTATVNTIVLNTTPSVTFNPGPLDTGVSTVTAVSPVTAGNTSDVTVVPKDQYGNNLGAGQSVSATATGSASVASFTDNGDGTYTASGVTDTVAEVVTVTASVNGNALTATPSVTFQPGPVDSAQSTVTATSPVTAGNNSTVTVTPKDQYGNNLGPTQSVSFTVISGSAYQNTSFVDNGDGTYTGTVGDTVAQTVSVTVTVNSVGLATTPNITFIPGPVDASMSWVTAGGSPATAGTYPYVTVTPRDAYGNWLGSGQSISVSVNFSAWWNTNSDNGDGTYTEGIGDYTAQTITVSVQVNGTWLATTPNITFVPGPVDAAVSSVVVDLTTQTVGLNVIGTAIPMDQYGNLLGAGQTISMSLTGSATMSAGTDVGDGSYTVTITDTVYETVTGTVTANGVTLNTTPTIDFTPDAFNVTTTTAVTTLDSQVADGSTSDIITITLKDQYGNLLGSAYGAGHVIGYSGGTATMSATYTDNGDGTYSLSITDTSTEGNAPTAISVYVSPLWLSATPNVSFIPGNADATVDAVVTSTDLQIANGTATDVITVTLEDAYGNPLGAAYGTGYTISSLGGLTSTMGWSWSDNGDGTYSIFITDTSTEGILPTNIQVYVGGNLLTNTANVTFIPGPLDAALSTAVVTLDTSVADGATDDIILVTLLDVQGNLLKSYGAGLTVSYAGMTGTMNDDGWTDNGDGTYTIYLSDTAVEGPITINVTVDGTALTSAAPAITFVPGPYNLNTSTAVTTVDNQTASAGSFTDVITVTLIDAYGHPLGATGAGAAITYSGLTGTMTDGGWTDNGDGTYTILLSDTAAEGPITINVSVDSSALTSAAPTVSFVAGPWDPAQSAAVTTTDNQTANGTAVDVITVTLLDQYGNAVTSSGGVATTAGLTGTMSDSVAPAGIVDNGDGTYTISITDTSIEGGAATAITVSIGGVALTSAAPTISFVPGPWDPAQSTAVTTTDNQVANGSQVDVIAVTLRDANGNLVGASGGGCTITGQTGTMFITLTNNGDGTYTISLTDTSIEGGAATAITVSIGGVALTSAAPTITFVPGPWDPSHSAAVTTTNSQTADGTAVDVITVTLRDANDNLVGASGGVATNAGLTGTMSDSVAPAGIVDNGDGTYTISITDTSIEGGAATAITVSIGGVALTSAAPTVSFVPGAWDTLTSAAVTTTDSQTADGTAVDVITVTLRDAHNNLVGASGGVATTTGLTGTMSDVVAPAGIVDNGDGTYTISITDTSIEGGAATAITVNIGGIALTSAAPTITFVPGAWDPLTSTGVTTTNSQTANGTAVDVITVTLRDAHNNLVGASGGVATNAGLTGTMSDSVAPAGIVDNGNGTYAISITDTSIEGGAATAITVSIGGVALTSAAPTVSFVPGPWDPLTSAAVTTTNSQTANGTAVDVITVTLRDAHNNLVGASGGVATNAGLTGTMSDSVAPAGIVDNGNGTYTISITDTSIEGGAATAITVSIGGVALTSAAPTITFVPGPWDPLTSAAVTTTNSQTADGTAVDVITVTLRDAHNNLVGASGGVATTTGLTGTMSDVVAPAGIVDNGNGTYTISITDTSIEGGAATAITVNIGGIALTSAAPTISFVPGAWDSLTSTAVTTTNNTDPDIITVTLRDAHNNLVGASGGVATTTGQTGTMVVTPTDNTNGTYTISITDTATEGPIAITVSIGGVALTSAAPTVTFP